MRILNPLVLASLLAIAVAGIFVWYYPSSILELGVEPTGTPLREVYQTQTVTGLPPSIQKLMNYQYPLAILMALSTFGAIYFGLSIETEEKWLIAIGCFAPILGILWFFSVLFSILIAIGGLIWLIVLCLKSNHRLLIPYFYCFVLNTISTIAIFLHINDIFAAIT